LSRIGIIGDVHANLPALEAVLADAGECDSWFCVGDTVGYGPYPNECTKMVRDLGALTVVGNHDLGSLGKIDLSSFNTDAREACRWTGGVLDDSARNHLDSLQSRLNGEGWMIVHASPRDPIWEYVLSKAQAYHNFLEFREKLCFHGHSHAPAIFRWNIGAQEADDFTALEVTIPTDGDEIEVDEDHRFLVNVGSVGQPRDGDRRSCYVIYDESRQILEYHRVPYQIDEIQKRMAEVGLPSFLVDRLAYGY
jgi:predicted phosphodiesterase